MWRCQFLVWANALNSTSTRSIMAVRRLSQHYGVSVLELTGGAARWALHYIWALVYQMNRKYNNLTVGRVQLRIIDYSPHIASSKTQKNSVWIAIIRWHRTSSYCFIFDRADIMSFILQLHFLFAKGFDSSRSCELFLETICHQRIFQIRWFFGAIWSFLEATIFVKFNKILHLYKIAILSIYF